MRNAFVNTLHEIAEKNNDIILITGDLGFGVLDKFCKNFPKQFINAGISEQNMAGVAAGMALEGKIVFTYSIANFPTIRCLEQIRNDIAYHKANVKIVAVGAGFAYGSAGMSHHATEDIAIMRAIPEMTIFSPCDPLEAEAVTSLAIEHSGPCYIRLGKGSEKNLHEKPPKVQLGVANILKQGIETAILTTGSIAGEALSAANKLEQNGIGCAVYSFPTIKPIDKELLIKLSQKYEFMFSLEEHNIVGGFGGAIAEILSENTRKTILKRIGLHDIFVSTVGSQDYLMKQCNLDSDSIVKTIEETLSLCLRT